MRLRGSTPSASKPSTTRVPSAPEAPETMIRSLAPWADADGVNTLHSARRNVRSAAASHCTSLGVERTGVMSMIPVIWDELSCSGYGSGTYGTGPRRTKKEFRAEWVFLTIDASQQQLECLMRVWDL